ncbi:MAG TPA: hypothetical protein DHV22_14960 [Xanthomarina gelatinilytica]|uniref:Uncharacterized protein n=1 Tax=Xanthomarina gelatinilytica TaxID=1137281 RepID=A0A3D6BUA0_9FLAO|nr:hypothetical protein [Xanthomarina gelatinilytica]|tara:strand:+ start:7387 stop:7683 length:297 start_codon:yes stop_codon:yes gene_type:complete
MSEEKIINELEAHENPLLAMTAETGESELKDYIVEFTGTKLDQEEVTVNMIAEVLAVEFPEFVFAFAEENFLRGYQLGIDDAYKTLGENATQDTEPND